MTDNAQIKDVYTKEVELNYQLYNGLFLTLPLDAVEQTGLLLPLLDEACRQGLEQGLSPQQIIEEFFSAHRPDFTHEQQMQFLFKVIQYVERQVVLIDALEDSAYSEIHRTQERDRLRQLTERAATENLQDELAKLLETFGTRIVLTAHPTQFYPGQVLAIITDLTAAIVNSDANQIRDLLQQLGNTPFFNKEKPSPFDEAIQLSWYLGNIFYPAFGKIMDRLAEQGAANNRNLLSIGFWPGGDRDGNPFVTCGETRRVAQKLRFIILECYWKDLRALKRRLSYKRVYERLECLEHQLHRELTGETEQAFAEVGEFESALAEVAQIVEADYQGLYLEQLVSFRRKVSMFGFHFASLDIRQDSRVIKRTLDAILQQHPQLLPANFHELPEAEQLQQLLEIEGEVPEPEFDDPVLADTLASLALIREIQANNGEKACHRYIISNCRGPRDVVNVIALSRLAGWSRAGIAGTDTLEGTGGIEGMEGTKGVGGKEGKEGTGGNDGPAACTLDVVPLFETVDDLRIAQESMAALYDMPQYARHLRQRGNQQTVMLGFSDGTKDGGYLMANWAIYQAKENITAISRKRGIEVVFFDGRGGPPARGGGSSYKFYAAMGKTVESSQIQLTVQGQTISSYYGTEAAALHNINQLLSAGLECNLIDRPSHELSASQRQLLDELASIAYEKYCEFKADPLFLPYLEEMSTLHYYAHSNIGSRPAKRGSGSELKFEDLRAIPFVGSWGQLKQNVPGYYGMGTAFKAMADAGRLEECQALFRESKFFEALLSNSMQSMSKTIFNLTRYIKDDPKYGGFWESIYQEFLLSREMVLKVSGYSELLEDNPTSQNSIRLRMEIVLPLLVIQQYAQMKLRAENAGAAEKPGGGARPAAGEDGNPGQDSPEPSVYERMIVRTMFGNINASRNSA